jgi:predicted phosphodiesterase
LVRRSAGNRAASSPARPRGATLDAVRRYRLLYVSDIHLRKGRSDALCGQVLDSVTWCKPDVVLLGGDLVDRRSELIKLSELVRKIQDVARCPEAAPVDGHVRVLCAHDPRIWKTSRHAGYDLVLAGHLHGCQLVSCEYRARLFPGAFFYPYCFLNDDCGSTLRPFGAVQISRRRLISRCGGSPNRRLYSRLNCEALS